MLLLFKEVTQQLRERAVSLEAIGIKGGVAWNIDDSLAVLKLLGRYYPSAVVLGGDVLIRRDDLRLEYIYANWHYDPMGSSQDAERSIRVAEDYLRDHFDNGADKAHLYIDFVIDNESLARLRG